MRSGLWWEGNALLPLLTEGATKLPPTQDFQVPVLRDPRSPWEGLGPGCAILPGVSEVVKLEFRKPF